MQDDDGALGVPRAPGCCVVGPRRHAEPMMDYWHGGRRGIGVGEFLRGPYDRRRDWTPRERLFEATASAMGIYNADRDPHRVYVTTDRELARGWAATHFEHEGGGALYRVRPLPPSSIEVDPDYKASGFSARRAEVLEVVEDLVQMDPDDALRAINCKYSVWTDDTPMYDYDGYMLPCNAHREGGATPELFRHLGKWYLVPPGHSVVFRAGRVSVVPHHELG